MINNNRVRIKDMPEFYVAYIRHVGQYAGDAFLFDSVYAKLFGWAKPKGLLSSNVKALSIFHDDPKKVNVNKLRTDICITVPKGTMVSGKIWKRTVYAGTYLVSRFELAAANKYQGAWDKVINDLNKNNKYTFREGLYYEVHINNPKKHPDNQIINICIPIKLKKKKIKKPEIISFGSGQSSLF